MEYNKVAAKQWADKLRNVGPRNFDMGESGEVGFWAMMLGTMAAMNTQTPSENIDKFEERLSETIKEEVEDCGHLTLSVDYGPDYILGRLAQETEVSTNGFPWKTTMWIEKGKVSVSAGYAAPEEIIFPIESAEE